MYIRNEMERTHFNLTDNASSLPPVQLISIKNTEDTPESTQYHEIKNAPYESGDIKKNVLEVMRLYEYIYENEGENENTREIKKRQKEQAQHRQEIADFFSETNYESMDISVLIEALYRLEKCCKRKVELIKDPTLSELNYILSLHLKYQWMKLAQTVHHVSVSNEYLHLGEPGASKVTGCHLAGGLRGGLGLYGKITTDVSLEKKYSADDEGAFAKEYKKDLFCKVDAGIGIDISSSLFAKGEVSAKGGCSKANFKQWKNANDFITHDACKVHRPAQTVSDRFFQIFKKKKGIEDLKKAQYAVINSQVRLNTLLKKKFKFNEGHDLYNVPVQIRPVSCAANYRYASGSALLGVSAGISDVRFDAGVRGEYQVSEAKIHEYVPESFIELKEASRLETLPRSFTAYCSLKKKSLGSFAILTELETDLIEYYALVNEYDYSKKSPFDDGTGCNTLRSNKHALEKKWGAVGRHQFLQYLSATFATLKRDLNKNEEKVLIEKVRLLLSSPSIYYSKARLEKIASLYHDVYLNVLDEQGQFEINTGPFKGRLELLKRERLHPSALREGSYFDITLTGECTLSGANLLDNTSLIPLITQVANENNFTLPTDLSFGGDFIGGSAISKTVRYFKPKYAQEEEYAGNKEWRKQFERDLFETSFLTNINVTAPLAPVLSLNAKLSAINSESRVRNERIAANDFIYCLIRFNRFYKNNKNNPNNQEWTEFTEAHKKEMTKLFLNISENKNKMKDDLDAYFSHINKNKEKDKDKDKELKESHFQELKRAFLKEVSEFKTSLSSENTSSTLDNPSKTALINENEHFQKMKAAFDLLAESMFEPWLKTHKSQWKPLSFTQKADSGLSRGTRVAKFLHLHPRFKEEDKKEDKKEVEEEEITQL